MNARFFASPGEFRDWLDEHHETESELVVGFYKKHTGRPSLTWSESVDEALCVGWIDGIRRRIDDEAYSIRFTPRRPKSTWSAINIDKMAALKAEGRVRPAGLRAFEALEAGRARIYTYEENRPSSLDTEIEAAFKCNPVAWEFFQALPPSHHRLTIGWIMSAKRPETRRRRLQKAIDSFERGKRVS
jgi:uncharacterized protein YdeI (YjbR/CyaY-like superfamily)